jgi:hypothetical protein
LAAHGAIDRGGGSARGEDSQFPMRNSASAEETGRSCEPVWSGFFVVIPGS